MADQDKDTAAYNKARAEYDSKERELNDKKAAKATSDYNNLKKEFDANAVLYKA
jgi:hypothetical protein